MHRHLFEGRHLVVHYECSILILLPNNFTFSDLGGLKMSEDQSGRGGDSSKTPFGAFGSAPSTATTTKETIFGGTAPSTTTASTFSTSGASSSVFDCSSTFGNLPSSSAFVSSSLFGGSSRGVFSKPLDSGVNSSTLFGRATDSGLSKPTSQAGGLVKTQESSLPSQKLFGSTPASGGFDSQNKSIFGASGIPNSSLGSSIGIPESKSLFGNKEAFSQGQKSVFGGSASAPKNVHSLFAASDTPSSSFGLLSQESSAKSSPPASTFSSSHSQNEQSTVNTKSSFSTGIASARPPPPNPFKSTSGIDSVVSTSQSFGNQQRTQSSVFDRSSKPSPVFGNISSGNSPAGQSSTIKNLFGPPSSVSESFTEKNTFIPPKKNSTTHYSQESKTPKRLPAVPSLFGLGNNSKSISSSVQSSSSFPIPSYDEVNSLSKPASSKSSTEPKKSPSYLDKAEPNVIIATNVPETYLDKSILKNHFSKFGTVVRISLHTKANQAQVTFTSHEAASLAKKKGKKLHPNVPDIMIFFGTAARSKPEEKQSDLITQKKNNAMKLLRQSSSETQEKSKKVIRKTGKEWLKSKSERPQSRRNYDDIPSELPTVSLKKKAKEDERSRRTSPAVESGLPVVTAKDFSSPFKIRAITSQEKYNTLEARDKLVRKLQVKEVDVSKAKYLSATCTDMCPEKERYMREVQYDLSPYEMTADRKVIHEKAVKKFSRSSADKDEPLPYELRTGPVLMRTMDYLLCNILPEMEDDAQTDLDVCYNYLWDRTRAMRSDITQQHLVDESAVYVLERCVRFHIFAAERLCTEPADIFDPKMNAEHLRKSMQTLKELYHDLAEKGSYFESEAEFRCYDILLNVGDGDIMFAYLLLRDSVRSSQEVQFAVEVLHAIQSNNYVRFFKLVEKATFLQACAMHKYFNRFRSKALYVMVKAYTIPGSSGKCQSVSLRKLFHIFSFETPEDTIDFLSAHNLRMNSNQMVEMDRNSFVAKPETPAPSYRSLSVIGSKKQGNSITAVLNGGSMPSNPLSNHVVHDSFLPEGYLKDSQELLKDPKSEKQDEPQSTSTKEASIISQVIPEITVCEENQSTETFYDTVTSDKQEIALPKDVDAEAYENDPSDELYNDYYVEGDGAGAINYDYDDLEKNYSEGEGLEDNHDGADYFEDVDDEKEEYEEIVDEFRERAETNLLKKCFYKWFDDMKSAQIFRKGVINLTQKGVFEADNDWRIISGLHNREHVLELLHEFKLKERIFIQWKHFAADRKEVRKARAFVLSRRVFTKWKAFVKMQEHQRYVDSLTRIVRSNLRQITLKSCVKQWLHTVHVARASRKVRALHRSRLASKYFNLWIKFCKEKQWQRVKLTSGFPAAPSRLSVLEQNKLWNFNCNMKRTYSDIFRLEDDVVKKRVKVEVARSLSEKICGTPLPLVDTFERLVTMSGIGSKPRLFTLALVFDENIDGVVREYIRVKFNKPSPNASSKRIFHSFVITSKHFVGVHTIKFVESRKENLSKENDISCIYFVSDSPGSHNDIMHFNHRGIMTDVVPLFINRDACENPKTSTFLVEQIVASYHHFASSSNIVSDCFSRVTTNFIARHVLHAFDESERIVSEFGLNPLPPQAFVSLLQNSLTALAGILNSSLLSGKEWISASSSQVHQCSKELQVKISSHLKKMEISPYEDTNVRSWTEAVNSVIKYLECCLSSSTHEFQKVSSDIVWFINEAREHYFRKQDDSDELPDIILLPWRKIYSSIITHKLSALPEIDVIYSTDELSSYSNAKWYQPYLKNLPSPRKTPSRLPSKPSNQIRKRKADGTFYPELTAEKEKFASLEAKLKQSIQAFDNGVYDKIKNYGQKMLTKQLDAVEDASEPLVQKIAREKENYKALEERLLKLL